MSNAMISVSRGRTVRPARRSFLRTLPGVAVLLAVMVGMVGMHILPSAASARAAASAPASASEANAADDVAATEATVVLTGSHLGADSEAVPADRTVALASSTPHNTLNFHPCANSGEPSGAVCIPSTVNPAFVTPLPAESVAITPVSRSVDPVRPPELGIPPQAHTPLELSISRT